MQLRAEIRNVQAQLKSAIQNHQMIVFKLKDRPVSINLRVQMCNVQRHIVSLGEKQKKLLSQLRKEMEENGESFKMDQKPNIQALQSFNVKPNPLNTVLSSKPTNIKKEPEIKTELFEENDVHSNPKPEITSHSSRRKSKLVAMQDVSLNQDFTRTSSSPSQKENTPSNTPSSSPTLGASVAKQQMPSTNTTAKQDSVPPSSASDESQDGFIHLPADPELRRKMQFMTALRLVTREVLTELQNRRSERKRRSTTNPQFWYGNVADQKRKKTVYLNNGLAAAPLPVVVSAEELSNP